MRGPLRGLTRATLAALLLVFAAAGAIAAPKEKGPAWASLTADQQQVLAPHEKRMFDVPPSYVPPAERRQRTTPSKTKQNTRYVLPAPL